MCAHALALPGSSAKSAGVDRAIVIPGLTIGGPALLTFGTVHGLIFGVYMFGALMGRQP
jgi:hypothetical protein